MEEVENLRAALLPFASKVNGEAMKDPGNRHRASVSGRANNDAYRAAWAALYDGDPETDG